MDSCHRTVVAKGLPINWFLSYVPNSELRCFEVVRQNYHKPIVILRLLLISSDLTWQVYVAEHLVPSESVLLKDFPSTVTGDIATNIIFTLSEANICLGNYDDRFITLAHTRKGKFLSHHGNLIAFLDESFCVDVEGQQYSCTIRHCNCEILTQHQICLPCKNFRNTLRALACKKTDHTSTITSLYANNRFLRTPQKNARLILLRKAIKLKTKQLQRLRTKLSAIMESDGISVDEQLRTDLEKVMDIHSVVQEDEFKRIFWEQQVIVKFYIHI